MLFNFVNQRRDPVIQNFVLPAEAARLEERRHSVVCPRIQGTMIVAANTTLVAALVAICDWTLTTGFQRNVLNNPGLSSCNDSIFINGNLARVTLSASKIESISAPKRESYRQAGLEWCDAFVALQLPITTSTGELGGYWDTGYSEIFIADTGTAVTALAICNDLQPLAARKSAYSAALDRYARFVLDGCDHGPAEPAKANASAAGCPAKGRGWVRDDGALGDGW